MITLLGIKRYLEAFSRTLGIFSPPLYLIVGVKTIYEEDADVELIFAVQFRKIIQKLFRKTVALKDEPFTGGAIL